MDAVRNEYPHASVFASTFDNFIRDVLPVKDQLPVITKEAGLWTWPLDPLQPLTLAPFLIGWRYMDVWRWGKPECVPSHLADLYPDTI